MHKEIKYVLLPVCLAAVLAGCTITPFSEDNPYKVDTVVQIPVDPTEAPTEAVSTETEEITQPRETVPEETVPETTGSKTTTSGGQTSSSSGKTSTSTSKNSASSTKTTEAPETQPPETEAATEPAETEPEATEGLTAEPAETEPPTQPPTEPPYDPSSYSVGSLEYAFLEQINSCRAEAGLAALALDTRLSGIAALRAQEAATVWSHTRPDGREYTTAMTDYGYGFGAAAENLINGAGTPDAAASVAMWMTSDAQAGNILNGGFCTVGIGVYDAGGFTYIAVLFVG